MKNNILGYRFECGCRYPIDMLSEQDKKHGILCPIHGTPWTHKIFKCLECGMYFKTTSHTGAIRCKSCQKDHTQYLSREWQRAKRIWKKENPGIEYKSETKPKKDIDQTRRGICAHGIDCVNNQLKNGIEFNCNGCQRFKRLELDIMDYISTTDTRWAEKRQEKWRR